MEAESISFHYSECMEAIASIEAWLDGRESLQYEYIVIDNASPDDTVSRVKELRQHDSNVKLYVNLRNYGPVRSPFAGLTRTSGDYVFIVAADLQEPPRLLFNFFKEAYANNYDAILGTKEASHENSLMWFIRGIYYKILKILSITSTSSRYSGFGLYSKSVIEQLRLYNCKEPSLRSLIPLVNCSKFSFNYHHEERKYGKSSYSLYSYAREAIRNMVRNTSSFPSFAGKIALLFSLVSIILFPVVVIAKLFNWEFFAPGLASLVLIVLSLNALLLFFMALILDKLQQLLELQLYSGSVSSVIHSETYE